MTVGSLICEGEPLSICARLIPACTLLRIGSDDWLLCTSSELRVLDRSENNVELMVPVWRDPIRLGIEK